MTTTTLAETILRDVPETKTARNPPPVEYLRKRLRYEPDTGKLFWLDYEPMPTWWRTRYAGKEAFIVEDSLGYRLGKVDDLLLRAHRVIWAMHHGEWPKNEIDHINGNPSDNRIANLRAATRSENEHNKSMRANNTSGVSGVTWDKRRGKWRTQVKTRGRYIHVGYFDDIQEAAQARAQANAAYGFSWRHGKSKSHGGGGANV